MPTNLAARLAVRLQVTEASLRRQEGQTTTEYAILLGFLAIAIIVAILLLRDEIRTMFSESAQSIENSPRS